MNCRGFVVYVGSGDMISGFEYSDIYLMVILYVCVHIYMYVCMYVCMTHESIGNIIRI